jgi:hypothetical protein
VVTGKTIPLVLSSLNQTVVIFKQEAIIPQQDVAIKPQMATIRKLKNGSGLSTE